MLSFTGNSSYFTPTVVLRLTHLQSSHSVIYVEVRRNPHFTLSSRSHIVFRLVISIIAFLLAIIFITLDNSDVHTRAVIGTVLILMAVAVVAVLHMDWGAIAPSPDSLWIRTQENVWNIRSFIGRSVMRVLQTKTLKRTPSLLPLSAHPQAGQVPGSI